MRAIQTTINVVPIYDGIVEGSIWPLVPDGRYLATYIDHDVVELAQFKKAAKVFIRLRLFDAGEHSGKVLFKAYRAKRRIDGKRFTVGARSELLKMVCRVISHRTRPDRISLRDLKHCLLQVSTRTVAKDGKQRELPEVLRYSVIDDILGKTTESG